MDEDEVRRIIDRCEYINANSRIFKTNVSQQIEHLKVEKAYLMAERDVFIKKRLEAIIDYEIPEVERDLSYHKQFTNSSRFKAYQRDLECLHSEVKEIKEKYGIEL